MLDLNSVLSGNIKCKNQFKLSFLSFAFTLSYALLAFYAALNGNSLSLWVSFFNLAPASVFCGLSTLILLKNQKNYNNYEFGLGKFESMFSLFFSTFILTYSISILYLSMQRIIYPQSIENIYFGFIFYIIFLITHGVFYFQSYNLFKKQQSIIVLAQKNYYKTRMGMDIVVLLPLSLSLFLNASPLISMSVDILCALIVCFIGIHSAFKTSKVAAFDLFDKTLDEDMQLIILKYLAKHFDLYTHYYGQKTRRSSNIKYIDLYLGCELNKSLAQTLEGINKIKADIERAIPNSEVNIILR